MLSLTPWSRPLRSVAAAGALAVAAVMPAQAALVVATFDPAYGADFPTLGWRGKANFDVATSCLLPGTGSIATPCAGSGLVTVLSAKVELYDLGDPLTVLKTLNFNPLSATVSKLWFIAGQLDGVESSLFDFVLDDAVTNVYFALQFTYDGVVPTGYRGPKLFWQDDPLEPMTGGVNDPTIRPATQFVVPEPTSLSLVAAALLAAGLGARRRRAAR